MKYGVILALIIGYLYSIFDGKDVLIIVPTLAWIRILWVRGFLD